MYLNRNGENTSAVLFSVNQALPAGSKGEYHTVWLRKVGADMWKQKYMADAL